MKKLISLWLLIAGFILLSASCRQSNYQRMSVDEFENALQEKGLQLVDVRTDVEYTESHIPGAININVMDVSFPELAGSTLSKDQPVGVYCRSGKRSKKAAEILSKAGYTVYDLDEGFNAWSKAGKETSR